MSEIHEKLNDGDEHNYECYQAYTKEEKN